MHKSVKWTFFLLPTILFDSISIFKKNENWDRIDILFEFVHILNDWRVFFFNCFCRSISFIFNLANSLLFGFKCFMFSHSFYFDKRSKCLRDISQPNLSSFTPNPIWKSSNFHWSQIEFFHKFTYGTKLEGSNERLLDFLLKNAKRKCWVHYCYPFGCSCWPKISQNRGSKPIEGHVFVRLTSIRITPGEICSGTLRNFGVNSGHFIPTRDRKLDYTKLKYNFKLDCSRLV